MLSFFDAVHPVHRVQLVFELVFDRPVGKIHPGDAADVGADPGDHFAGVKNISGKAAVVLIDPFDLTAALFPLQPAGDVLLIITEFDLELHVLQVLQTPPAIHAPHVRFQLVQIGAQGVEPGARLFQTDVGKIIETVGADLVDLFVVGDEILPPALNAHIDTERYEADRFDGRMMPPEVIDRDEAFALHGVKEGGKDIAVHGLGHVMMLESKQLVVGGELVLQKGADDPAGGLLR